MIFSWKMALKYSKGFHTKIGRSYYEYQQSFLTFSLNRFGFSNQDRNMVARGAQVGC